MLIVVGPKLRLTINKLLIAVATIQIRTFPRREKVSRRTHSDHETGIQIFSDNCQIYILNISWIDIKPGTLENVIK